MNPPVYLDRLEAAGIGARATRRRLVHAAGERNLGARPRRRDRREIPESSRLSLGYTDLPRVPVSIPKNLGPYEVLGPLGSGGMGEVWKARDTRLDRIVAIKISSRPNSRSASSAKRAPSRR